MSGKRQASGGATPQELRLGIGFQMPWLAPHPGEEARRGAAVMRSRWFDRRGMDGAFRDQGASILGINPGLVQAIGGIPIVPGDGRFIAAFAQERERGCPAWP